MESELGKMREISKLKVCCDSHMDAVESANTSGFWAEAAKRGKKLLKHLLVVRPSVGKKMFQILKKRMYLKH